MELIFIYSIQQHLHSNKKSILQKYLQEKLYFIFHPTNNYLFTEPTSTNKENPTENSSEESSVASSSSASSVYSNVSPIP